MKVVVHKCPNCNASLKVKDNLNSGTCEYCGSHYAIDDGVIRIEHTVEVTDDTSLKIANTTLKKFKDYTESERLYRNLLYKYAHKPDVYIGLILSITKDFTEKVNNYYTLNEINNYWNRFTSIGDEKEVKKYISKINNLNKDFWYARLIEATNNFGDIKGSKNLKTIDNTWNNYISFCDDKERTSIEGKYTKFINEKAMYVKKRKKIIKISLISLLLLAIVTFISLYVYLTNEKVVIKNNNINISVLNKYCTSNLECNGYDFITDNINNTTSKLTINNISTNKDEMFIDVSITLKNIFKQTNGTYRFNLIDDLGPVIESANCVYKDTDDVDVYKCFTLYDYTDGNISSKKASVKMDGIDFTTIGNKKIEVSATDSDGNTENKIININIVKSDIKLKLKLSKNYIEKGSSAKITSSISPDVNNKKVTYTYDKKYVSISGTTIKGIKPGVTKVCATSSYDNSKKTCINVRVTAKCKSTYTFKFNGSDEEKITTGKDFCPGKYRVYASLLNNNNSASLRINNKDGRYLDSILIWKIAPSLSDEGGRYSFSFDSSISIPSGVTSVKLVKQ